MESHQRVNQTSGNTELYTPPELIEAARRVMGGIDLDPASSVVANENVKASHIFTEADGGIMQNWWGRVWMNHPWGARETACKPKCKKKICKRRGYHLKKEFPGNEAWINKIADSYELAQIEQALCITYASTSEVWFKRLKQHPVCLLDGRTAFYTPEGKKLDQNTKGCAVTYFGPNVEAFYREFSRFGEVVVPYSKLLTYQQSALSQCANG